mmetsp:Transcript_47752/g.135860  ORF Transcript_47752/g.135860 Transcript_47752/m.135860 type:complete len:250 (-) Transcript_47752:306-1055(-)
MVAALGSRSSRQHLGRSEHGPVARRWWAQAANPRRPRCSSSAASPLARCCSMTCGAPRMAVRVGTRSRKAGLGPRGGPLVWSMCLHPLLAVAKVAPLRSCCCSVGLRRRAPSPTSGAPATAVRPGNVSPTTRRGGLVSTMVRWPWRTAPSSSWAARGAPQAATSTTSGAASSASPHRCRRRGRRHLRLRSGHLLPPPLRPPPLPLQESERLQRSLRHLRDLPRPGPDRLRVPMWPGRCPRWEVDHRLLQ